MTDTVAMVEQYPELANMIADIATRVDAAEFAGTGDDFVKSIMERITAAETFDDIFAAQESTNLAGKDFVDRPFIIWSTNDIAWRPSSQQNVDQGAFPFYAIIKLTPLDTGEETVINCGGKTFVAVLWALMNRGYFDDQPEEGRPLMIRSVASPGGAYLQLFPYKILTRAKK